MPTYDLTLLLRVMPKKELAVVLKRAAGEIFKNGGIIRRIDNLGQKPMPYKISKNSQPHREACNFIMEFNYPPAQLKDLSSVLRRDVDIVRSQILPHPNYETKECTFEEEMRPAPYRSEVQKMIAVKRTRGVRFTEVFTYRNGLDYNPLN